MCGLRDLVLVLGASPGTARSASGVMMARVRPSGLFELLSAEAWVSALGYAPEELSGKPLCQLLEKAAADRVVSALLDEEVAQPLDITLRCKDERRKSFRFYRRFDSYEGAIYVVADELPESALAPLTA
jgi:hypothetical protein